MAYVDKEGVGHLSRADRLKTAGVVFLATAAIFGLSRIDTKSATKYDPQTETALERVIQPRMVMAARKIIALAQKHPYKSYTSVKRNVIETSISDSGINPLIDSEYYLDLEVATRRLGDSKEPDPEAVTAVSISSSSTLPGSRTNASEGNVTLCAPGGANTLIGMGNGHPNGWSAQEGGSSGSSDRLPYLLDTSDRDLFANDTSFNPSDPVTTAKKIVKDLPLELKSAQLDLESRRWSH
jgi:hypothetical protein